MSPRYVIHFSVIFFYLSVKFDTNDVDIEIFYIVVGFLMALINSLASCRNTRCRSLLAKMVYTPSELLVHNIALMIILSRSVDPWFLLTILRFHLYSRQIADFTVVIW